MSLFSKKKIKKEISLIFDIGSDSVGGAILITKTDEIPTIVYTFRHEYILPDLSDFTRLYNALYEAVNIVARNLVLKGLVRIHQIHTHHSTLSHVFCIYTSPWCMSQVEKIIIDEKKSFRIDAKMLDNALISHMEQFQNSPIGKHVQESGETVSIIDQNIIDITLNGYSVKRPLGKTVQKLSASIFTGVVPKIIATNIESIIHRVCTANTLSHHVFSLTLFTTLKTYMASPKDFVFIDIGNHVTDIGLVKNGSLQEITSFPKGTNCIIENVSQSSALSQKQIREMLRVQTHGKLAISTRQHIDKQIAAAVVDWGHILQESLLHIKDYSGIPQAIFIFCQNPTLLETISANLREPGINFLDQHTLITPVNMDQLLLFCKMTEMADQQDARLLATSMYAQYHMGIGNSQLKKNLTTGILTL